MMADKAEIVWRPTAAPETADNSYEQPVTEKRILQAGWKLTPAHAPFLVDTVWEKDIHIPLRDGVNIRADVYRPDTASPVPILVAWSPYGKSACRFGGFDPLEAIPGRVGVPKNRLSGFQKFEAPDPAEWVARGYAVINPDSRGTYDSEGDMNHFGTPEAQDGYDVIEHIANFDWCNGKVALVGNSWLGMAQWFIAAERPPHLACIAPLEGASDLYRELLCRGGIPQTAFWDFLSSMLRGRSRQEDVGGMLKKYPLMTEYWSDKRAKIDHITVPAYVLASYSTFLHTFGSFRGYMEIPHREKWLRVHHTQEWHDLYQTSTNDDLQRFFDRYTKGVDNGWEKTSKVRLCILNYTEDPIVNKEFPDWPLQQSVDEILHLNKDQNMSHDQASVSGTVRYISDGPFQQIDQDTEEVPFSYTFEKACYLVGCARAVLYMSCDDHNDLDVFVQLRKADKDGKVLRHLNIPIKDRRLCDMPEPVDLINPLVYLGPTGCLRASHRALDPKLTTSWWPEHDYTKREPIQPGKVVRLEIGMWQTGMAFEAGEKLILKVAGHPMMLAEFPQLRGAMPTFNRGVHQLHFGGDFPSHLVIPTLSPDE